MSIKKFPIRHLARSGSLCDDSGMETPPNNLKKFRRNAGLTLEQLAELAGTTKAQIQRMENGTRPLLDRWKKALAPHLGVEPWQLTEGAPEYGAPAPAPRMAVSDVPVYGYASGASERIAINEGAIIGRVPERMPGMGQDGFYLIVHGDSMEPRLEQGMKIGVSRQLPPRKGKLCVVEKVDGDVVVKEFVSKTERTLTVRQMNPAKLIEINMNAVLAVYAVVGTCEY